ncbi:uncharacterized protein LOC6562583 [Drosophila grimshawi]|uniref:GH10925 n=1 Tax=Drosophila grimshawi TaxID=7222 RepID=B4JAY8_DROGR|nr:uncharacterized protein LOC6562583 [Drosophila grimshawi]EDW02858.1 GH10925 [Drosophila grimshawi]
MSKAKSEKPRPKFKFPMRDIHLNKSLRILKTACILSLVAPFCLYMLSNAPRKLKYKNFYANYDPMDAFDRMQSGGYLASCSNSKSDDKKDKDKDKDKKK